MKVEKFTDYLSFTLPHSADYSEVLPNECMTMSERINPAYGYKLGIEHAYGVRVYKSDEVRMGIHVVMSGKALHALRHRHDITHDEIIRRVVLARGSFSRVDVAVTAYDSGFNLDEMQSYWSEGKIETRMRSHKEIRESAKTQTFYVGSLKKRTRLFRAYDKAAEMGEGDLDIKRFELESRKYAHNVAMALKEGADIGGLIRRYVDIPESELWVKIMDAIPESVAHSADSATENDSRWHWLMTSVAPAMARAIVESGESGAGNLDAFASAVQAHIRRLKA